MAFRTNNEAIRYYRNKAVEYRRIACLHFDSAHSLHEQGEWSLARVQGAEGEYWFGRADSAEGMANRLREGEE